MSARVRKMGTYVDKNTFKYDQVTVDDYGNTIDEGNTVFKRIIT